MQKQRKSKDTEKRKNGQPVQNAPLAPLEAALSASYALQDVDSSRPLHCSQHYGWAGSVVLQATS